MSKLVTPEYLLSHGFRLYKDAVDGDCCDIPFLEGEGILHFREIELHRQMFVVIYNIEGDGYLHGQGADVYVQHNIGCGFVEIPFPWWELSVEYFESVYYGIRGEKPKYTGFVAEDAEYEIIQPKQLKQ